MSTFYLPIGTPEMIAMAQSLSNGRATKHGGAGCTLICCTDSGATKWRRRKVGHGLLRNVAAHEKMYVLTHGLVNAEKEPVGTVGARRNATPTGALVGKKWTGGTMRSYTPQSLAEHLLAEDLTLQYVDLRLFICYSGVTSNHLPGNVSFAEALRDSMRALGFGRIVVTGYKGALGSSYGNGYYEENWRGIEPAPAAPHLTGTLHKLLEDGRIASLHKVRFGP